MDNNLYDKEKLTKKLGKFVDLLETTTEETQKRLKKYYIATNKLFHNQPLDDDEEKLFKGIDNKILEIYNPISTFFEDKTKKYPRYLVETLKEIFSNYESKNLTDRACKINCVNPPTSI